MYRRNDHNMSYTIINDQHKFSAWDPNTEINYGPNSSKMAGGILIFTIALSNSKTSSNSMIVSNPCFETRSSLSARNVAHSINVMLQAYNVMKY